MGYLRREGGARIVEPAPREGSVTEFYSPNWCDSTTWHHTSVRVVDEVLSTADNITYTPATDRVWIDMHHGKLAGERSLRASKGVEVKVDDVVKAHNTPGTSDGDFDVTYTDPPAIVFNSALSGTPEIKCSYNYMVDSCWIIVPDAGKRLVLMAVEVQFSSDIVLTTAAVFEPWAYNPADLPNKFAIPGMDRHYDTMVQYVQESQRSYPVIPKLGGANWRAMPDDLHQFRWPYGEEAVRIFNSSQGAELRIYLEGDTPFSGSYATASVYALSEDE